MLLLARTFINNYSDIWDILTTPLNTLPPKHGGDLVWLLCSPFIRSYFFGLSWDSAAIFSSSFFAYFFQMFIRIIYTVCVCVCVCLDYSSWQTNEALLLGSSIQPSLPTLDGSEDWQTDTLSRLLLYRVGWYFSWCHLLLFFTAAPPGGCADHFKVYRCVLLCFFFLGRDDRPPSFLSLQLVQFSADVLLGMLIPPYICCCCCCCWRGSVH